MNKPRFDNNADYYKYMANREYRKYRYYQTIMKDFIGATGLPGCPDNHVITATTLKGIRANVKKLISKFLKASNQEDIGVVPSELERVLGFYPSFIQHAKKRSKRRDTDLG